MINRPLPGWRLKHQSRSTPIRLARLEKLPDKSVATGSAPRTRGGPDRTDKRASKVRLVGEAELRSDLCQWKFPYQQVLGVRDAGVYLPLMRCPASRSFERTPEMGRG
jgi:hypothetical protein